MSNVGEVVFAISVLKSAHAVISEKSIENLVEKSECMKKRFSDTDYEEGVKDGYEQAIKDAMQIIAGFSIHKLTIEDLFKAVPVNKE